MLDLDGLFAASLAPSVSAGAGLMKFAETEAEQGFPADFAVAVADRAGHSGHNGNSQFSAYCVQPKPAWGKAFKATDTADTADTVDFQGGESLNVIRSPGGGAAKESFALHPAAVLLVLAYCQKVGACSDEKTMALLQLESMPPSEQVRHWGAVCLSEGIKPWLVLTIPAQQEGKDCTLCRYLQTRQFSGADGRRCFHWACGLGFLILETGRGTERIWIAPPECNSWERWLPANGVTCL